MNQKGAFLLILLLHFVVCDAVHAKQSTADAKNKRPVIQVITKLGVDATFEVHDTSVETGDTDDDAVLAQYDVGGHHEKIILKMSDGVYISIPLETFLEASERDGLHVVKLSNGQELKGKMVSILHDSNNKPHDLRVATKVVLKSLPESQKAVNPGQQKSSARWDLLLKPIGFKHTVVDPSFAYRYYSTAGYVQGGRMRVGYTKSFYLLLENDNVQVDPADFQTIFLNQATPQDEEKIQNWAIRGTPGAKTIVKTIARSGTETVGKIGFKPPEDSTPFAYGDWYLVLNSFDSEIKLILKAPVCSLQKTEK